MATGNRIDTLTAREREVLAHLSTGARTRDIAIRLGIAEPTVKRHLTNLYRKLGARNRVEAVTAYLLVPTEPGRRFARAEAEARETTAG